MSRPGMSAALQGRAGPKAVGQGSSRATVSVPPGRLWTITTRTGYTARGYLPGWAQEDPSQAGIPPDALPSAVHDVIHRSPFDGQLIRLAQGGYGPGTQEWVLTGNIECIPDADDDQPPVPVANIHFFGDHWLTGLGPREVGIFAAQLRAQADRLDDEVRQRLVAYRADWFAHSKRPALQGHVPHHRT